MLYGGETHRSQLGFPFRPTAVLTALLTVAVTTLTARSGAVSAPGYPPVVTSATFSPHHDQQHVNVVNRIRNIFGDVSDPFAFDDSWRRSKRPPKCWKSQHMTLAGSTSVGSMAMCPWVTLTDTNPNRIPREIQYARCLCSQPQVNARDERAYCWERSVNVTYLLCDPAPSLGDPYNCTLNVKLVPVACATHYHLDMK